MGVLSHRTRTEQQHSTWARVATIAGVVLGILVIVAHVLSRTVVDDSLGGDLPSPPVVAESARSTPQPGGWTGPGLEQRM